MKTTANVFGWGLMYLGAAMCVPGLILLALGDYIEGRTS